MAYVPGTDPFLDQVIQDINATGSPYSESLRRDYLTRRREGDLTANWLQSVAIALSPTYPTITRPTPGGVDVMAGPNNTTQVLHKPLVWADIQPAIPIDVGSLEPFVPQGQVSTQSQVKGVSTQMVSIAVQGGRALIWRTMLRAMGRSAAPSVGLGGVPILGGLMRHGLVRNVALILGVEATADWVMQLGGTDNETEAVENFLSAIEDMEAHGVMLPWNPRDNMRTPGNEGSQGYRYTVFDHQQGQGYHSNFVMTRKNYRRSLEKRDTIKRTSRPRRRRS